MLNMNVIQESPINQEETSYNEGFKYDFGYSISLNYANEDGLMDTYLTGIYNIYYDQNLILRLTRLE